MTINPQYLLGVVDTRVMTLLDLGGPFIDEVNPSSPYLGTRVPIGTFLTIWIPRDTYSYQLSLFHSKPSPHWAILKSESHYRQVLFPL